MSSVQESQFQYDLQLQRSRQLDNSAFEKNVADITPPKKGKYVFAATLAIIGDIVDLLDITGIGEIVTLIVDFIIDPLLIWLGIKMNKEVKKKEQSSKGLNSMIEGMNKKIEGYRNAIQTVRNAPGKLARFKKSGQKIKVGLKLKKPKAVTKKGVLGKILAAIGIDMIPLAELYPARTHSVWSSYKTEKAAYEESLDTIRHYQEVRAVELEEKVDYIDSLLEEQENFEEFEAEEQSQIAA